MKCVRNVVSRLAELSSASSIPTGCTVVEPVNLADTVTPHRKFTKAFSQEPVTHSPKLKVKLVSSKSKPSSKPVQAEDYGDDADTRLRKFYEQAEPQTSYTLEEIANAMGVTKERVRQIEAQALRKFRRRFQQFIKNEGIDFAELQR